MKPDTKKKVKQVGFIAAVCIGTITAINHLSQKSKAVAKVRSVMAGNSTTAS